MMDDFIFEDMMDETEDESYLEFCKFMKRYESGQRGLSESEKKLQEELLSSGEPMQPLPFDRFLENMRRFEAGERQLNEKEKEYNEYMSSTGQAYQPLPFDKFLENMRKYVKQEKSTQNGMHR